MNYKLKGLRSVGTIAILSLVLVACSSTGNTATKEESNKDETQTINYLDETYEVPSKVDKIATASQESMEDAAILDVKPAAAITIGGEIPDYLDMDLEGIEPIGEKKEPNYETLLKVKPDVIMWTTKSPADVTEQLEKVAPTFPYSHFSSDWDDNLRLMAELTDKEKEAEEIIDQYNNDVGELKDKLASKMQDDEQVIMVRIREGNVFLYSEDVYFNPVLYDELGLTIPDEVKAVEGQEMITLEKLAEMDPDYLFVQFSENENADDPQALEKLENDPIWQSLQASKDDHVFVNAVDNLAQGGTAWSKISFLEAVKDTLDK